MIWTFQISRWFHFYHFEDNHIYSNYLDNSRLLENGKENFTFNTNILIDFLSFDYSINIHKDNNDCYKIERKIIRKNIKLYWKQEEAILDNIKIDITI